jgi:hypothetical protein
MGFFGNLKAASTTSFATQFVQKHLELQKTMERGFRGDAKDTASRIVMALWGDIPELAQQKVGAKPLLVAAAALANAVEFFNAQGKQVMAGDFKKALTTLMLQDVMQIVKLDNLSPIDQRLWDKAFAIYQG